MKVWKSSPCYGLKNGNHSKNKGHNFTAFLPVFAKNRCYYDRVDSLGIGNTPLIGYLISFSIRNFAGAFYFARRW